jgi:hypothetical protein
VKTTATWFALILIIVGIAFFGPLAFAETIGPEGLPLYAALEPVNMILLGMGLLFAGTRA